MRSMCLTTMNDADEDPFSFDQRWETTRHQSEKNGTGKNGILHPASDNLGDTR